MKYIYIVTRITPNNKPWVTEIPNLGVHTNYRNALRHWNSVVSDREKTSKGSGGVQFGNRHDPFPEQYLVLAEMRFREERVRLEKWRVG